MEIISSNKIKLKWKEPKKYKDDYTYPIVQVQESNGDLCFKFTPYKGATFKALYMTIENYKQYSALDIVNALEDIRFNTRHSYDAVLQFYHKRDLDLGFTRKILKQINYGNKRI